MPTIRVPDYGGGSLVNLVAELEARLTGTAPAPRLHHHLAELIPERDSYVVVLFDGLGSHQLEHPAAADLKSAHATTLDAPFPTTTTVSLATIATGLPPSQHGLLGYQLWMPEIATVVNTIKWTTLWGEPVAYDTTALLPAPNMWERLGRSGIEPLTIQPAGFEGSPLTKALYRGCRFEGITSLAELVDATVALAGEPGRVILVYVPHVDFAAHVHGQDSAAYEDALAVASWVWDQTAARLGGSVVLLGTADHGHLDFPRERRVEIVRDAHKGREFYGDGRVMFVRGEGRHLAEDLPASWFYRADMESWWGPEPRHAAFDGRAPDGVLVADDDHCLLHRHSDDRLIGNHGGLTGAEVLVPLLVAVSG
jgi:hypothetical protein